MIVNNWLWLCLFENDEQGFYEKGYADNWDPEDSIWKSPPYWYFKDE